MISDSPETFARSHGYVLVQGRRGWRVLGPRERARCRIDGEYYWNINDAWRAAARRIEKALASRRRLQRALIDYGKRNGILS